MGYWSSDHRQRAATPSCGPVGADYDVHEHLGGGYGRLERKDSCTTGRGLKYSASLYFSEVHTVCVSRVNRYLHVPL